LKIIKIIYAGSSKAKKSAPQEAKQTQGAQNQKKGLQQINQKRCPKASFLIFTLYFFWIWTTMETIEMTNFQFPIPK